MDNEETQRHIGLNNTLKRISLGNVRNLKRNLEEMNGIYSDTEDNVF